MKEETIKKTQEEPEEIEIPFEEIVNLVASASEFDPSWMERDAVGCVDGIHPTMKSIRKVFCVMRRIERKKKMQRFFQTAIHFVGR